MGRRYKDKKNGKNIAINLTNINLSVMVSEIAIFLH